MAAQHSRHPGASSDSPSSASTVIRPVAEAADEILPTELISQRNSSKKSATAAQPSFEKSLHPSYSPSSRFRLLDFPQERMHIVYVHILQAGSFQIVNPSQHVHMLEALREYWGFVRFFHNLFR